MSNTLSSPWLRYLIGMSEDSLNGGIKLQLTLDQAENVVKQNDAAGDANQITEFQLSACVCLWDAITLDSALQTSISSSLRQVELCCGRDLNMVHMIFHMLYIIDILELHLM